MKRLFAFVIIILTLLTVSACKEKEQTFTLFYNTNGGNSIPSVSLTKDQAAPLPQPTYGDNEFLGWYIDKDFDKRVAQPLYIDKDTTIYACWKLPEQPPEPKSHIDVTFVLHNQDNIVQTIANGAALESFPHLNRDGYHLWWYTDSAYTNLFDIDTQLSNDTNIYGRWRAIFNITEGAITSLTEYGKTLKEITIPLTIEDNEITKIASTGFRNCELLETVHISKNITEIGSRIFYGSNKLLEITVDETNNNFIVWNGALYTKDYTRFLAFPKAKDVSQFTIHANTTFIANDAFGNCREISKIELPIALEKIDMQAFTDCYADILFSEGTMTTIHQNAFSGYKGDSILLCDTITTIEEYAFKNCINLTSITLPSSLQVLNKRVFYMCNNLESLIIPQDILEIYGDAFIGCNKIEKITINAINPPELGGDINNINIPTNIIFEVYNKNLYDENEKWRLLLDSIVEIDR